MKTERIAFTSCIRYEAFPNQRQWQDVKMARPDHLLLLGDQIYMDYGLWPFSQEWNEKPKTYSETEFESIMSSKYRAQCNEPNFLELVRFIRSRKGRICAVWDDHDFAWNNARGVDVPEFKKKISLKLFKKWFPPVQERLGEIFQAFDTELARVIMLDVRSHSRKPNNILLVRQKSSNESDLLGEAQFEFLERELNTEGEKPFTIICSGLTLRYGDENWIKYPNDFFRLIGAIKDSKKRIIFLGGDIHRNALVPPSEGIPFYEVISSGFAVNYLGLGIPQDDRNNWGLLDLSESGAATVTLYRHGVPDLNTPTSIF